MIRAEEFGLVQPTGRPMPFGPQFSTICGFELVSQRMQGSTDVCAEKAVWLARNSSYSAGARNEVPTDPRKRSCYSICQFRPTL